LLADQRCLKVLDERVAIQVAAKTFSIREEALYIWDGKSGHYAVFNVMRQSAVEKLLLPQETLAF
jgi:1,2-phenylacetyl-CoA epoxidase PaaB subunit